MRKGQNYEFFRTRNKHHIIRRSSRRINISESFWSFCFPFGIPSQKAEMKEHSQRLKPWKNNIEYRTPSHPECPFQFPNSNFLRYRIPQDGLIRGFRTSWIFSVIFKPQQASWSAFSYSNSREEARRGNIILKDWILDITLLCLLFFILEIWAICW